MSTEQDVQMQKFDGTWEAEYEHQSRIALAGHEACHELSACMLMAPVGQSTEAEVLVAGAGGTAQEIVTIAALRPFWKFTAVDPWPPVDPLSWEDQHTVVNVPYGFSWLDRDLSGIARGPP
jgi:tRNA (cmo5U34)-methyltransferase